LFEFEIVQIRYWNNDSLMVSNLTFGIFCVVAIGFMSVPAEAQIPPIPAAVQRSIERTIGTAGTYAADESVFRIRIPRSDIALSLHGQRVTSGFQAESWVGFSPEIRGGGLMMGELELLEEEVDPVASAALEAGLDITGLANTAAFDQPRLMTMNVTGTGSFDKLAGGVRKSLDAIAAAHANKATPAASPFPKASAIDAGPIDAILSMKGTVTNGIYRAAIGQISVLNNTPFGKPMGASTSVVFIGTNEDALLQAEIVCTAEQLQRTLKAPRSRSLSLTSIRNHTLVEHPQLIFIRFSGRGTAKTLANSVRYTLDAQVGNIRPAA
jgi:hypothetical protein